MGRIPLPRKPGGPHESDRYERHEEREAYRALEYTAPTYRIGDRVVDLDGKAGEVVEIRDPGAFRPVDYAVRYDDGTVASWNEADLAPPG